MAKLCPHRVDLETGYCGRCASEPATAKKPKLATVPDVGKTGPPPATRPAPHKAAVVLPALSDTQYEALKADIAARGVMVPVEVDADTGEILDGAHRQRACGELGIDTPIIERRFDTDAERVAHALKLNLLRRQLSDEAWSDAFEQLAEARGVRLGSGKGDPTGKAATTAALASELGLSERQARQRRANAKRVKDLRDVGHADLAEQVNAGEVELKRAERVARERVAEAKRAEEHEPLTVHDQAEIRLGDFRECLADLAGTVDAIITDPPYGQDYDDIYPAITRVAATLLKPTGCLAVLCGTRPELWLRRLPAMEETMPLRWVGCYLTPGASYRVQGMNVASNWKPVLIFGADRNLNSDLFRSSGDAKEHHRWGQNEDAFASLVQAFSDPGQLVVDPFLGAGTTAVVCAALGRRFVGCDTDGAAVSTARERLEA